MCKLWPLNYVFIVAVMQLAAIVGVLLGLALQFWWSRHTPETKQQYSAFARANCIYLGLAVAAGLVLFGVFLWRHTELDPWTGRRRLFLFSDRTLEKHAERDSKHVLKSTRLAQLDAAHPVYKRVAAVMARLLDANSDVDSIRDRRWTVVVVNTPKINATVGTSGLVVVYVGLTSMANDDQLAILVGHEFAHCLLRHSNQIGSAMLVVNALLLVPVTVVIWATMPFFWNVLAHLLWAVALKVCIILPLVRSSETEADRVGMELAAKACVDVTQGYRFWDAMSEMDSPSKWCWWLSMHPTTEGRSRHLFSLIPAAKEIQKQAAC